MAEEMLSDTARRIRAETKLIRAKTELAKIRGELAEAKAKLVETEAELGAAMELLLNRQKRQEAFAEM